MTFDADTIALVASHRRIAPFRLHRPRSVVEACGLLAEHGAAAHVHAGGIDLVGRMKAGARPAHLVALDGIPALAGTSVEGGVLRIGAMTRHWRIESDPLVRERLPSLSAFVAGLGNVRIRMQGTLGGNVMSGEPLYEMLPALAVLDAALVFADATGKAVRMPAIERLQAVGPAPGLLLVAVEIPLAGRVLAWNRDLRAAHGLECVAGVVLREHTIVGGAAAFIGDRAGAVAASLRPELGPSPAAIATDWAVRLPAIASTSGASATYCRQVATVILRRALGAL